MKELKRPEETERRIATYAPLCTQTETREKCELFDHYLFVVAKDLHQDATSGSLKSFNLNIILFHHAVLTLHSSEQLHAQVLFVCHVSRVTCHVSCHVTSLFISSLFIASLLSSPFTHLLCTLQKNC